MTNKERIIQLLEQNILTMDEAIRLLKAEGSTIETNLESITHESDKLHILNEQKQEALQLLVQEKEKIEQEIAALEDLQESLEEEIVSLEELGLNELVEQKEAQLDNIEETLDSKEKRLDEIEDLIDSKEDELDTIKDLLDSKKEEFDVNNTTEEVTQNIQDSKSTLSSSLTDTISQTLKNVAQVIESSTNITSSVEELEQEIKDKESEKKTKEEALVIAKQRHRELEILAELDELSEELITQQCNLAQRTQELTSEISMLEEGITLLNQKIQTSKKEQLQQSAENIKEDIKQFVAKTTQTASQLNEPITRHRIGKSIFKKMSNWTKNFSSKEFYVKVNVPWVKGEVIEHTFNFSESNVKEIDFNVANGDIKVLTHDAQEIQLFCECATYGQRKISAEELKQLLELSCKNNRLICHSNSSSLNLDIVVMLPKQLYKSMTLFAKKGDVEVMNLDVDQLEIKGNVSDVVLENILSKNININTSVGDIVMSKIQTNLLDAQVMTGDITVSEVNASEAIVKTVTGDLIIQGNVSNLSANTVTGDVKVTQYCLNNSDILAKTATGDVKVALPSSLNLEVVWNAHIGDKKQRLSNVQEVSKNVLNRMNYDDNIPLVTLNASTNVGDIYLKDNDKLK